VLASVLMLSRSTRDRADLFTLGALLCILEPGLGWLVAFRCCRRVLRLPWPPGSS
jgi:hypothetical protein